jgi:DNA excision repair protein ERCC-3
MAEAVRRADVSGLRIGVVKELVAKHAGERILVIGQYLDQIDELGYG